MHLFFSFFFIIFLIHIPDFFEKVERRRSNSLSLVVYPFVRKFSHKQKKAFSGRLMMDQDRKELEMN